MLGQRAPLSLISMAAPGTLTKYAQPRSKAPARSTVEESGNKARTFIGPRMVPFHRVSMMSSASAKPYDTEPGTADMATPVSMQPAGTIHAKQSPRNPKRIEHSTLHSVSTRQDEHKSAEDAGKKGPTHEKGRGENSSKKLHSRQHERNRVPTRKTYRHQCHARHAPTPPAAGSSEGLDTTTEMTGQAEKNKQPLSRQQGPDVHTENKTTNIRIPVQTLRLCCRAHQAPAPVRPHRQSKPQHTEDHRDGNAPRKPPDPPSAMTNRSTRQRKTKRDQRKPIRRNVPLAIAPGGCCRRSRPRAAGRLTNRDGLRSGRTSSAPATPQQTTTDRGGSGNRRGRASHREQAEGQQTRCRTTNECLWATTTASGRCARKGVDTAVTKTYRDTFRL